MGGPDEADGNGKETVVREEQGETRYPDGTLTAAQCRDMVRSRKLDMGEKPLELPEWTLENVL